MDKWGDHQKKKFFVDNAAQALILFKEGHQGLLKLHVHLGERFLMLEEKARNFVRGGRKIYEETIQNLLKSCVSYGLPKEGRRVLTRKKLGRHQSSTVKCEEAAFENGIVKTPRDPSCMTVL